MVNKTRPTDPFARLTELATDQQLFTPSPAPDTHPRVKPSPMLAQDSTQKPTPKSAPSPDRWRETIRETSRAIPRQIPRELPSRDEVQEFSFRLRDEIKVKVQAEVPHSWQDELEELARKLDVKKLELYRFILGEFLGKVWRKDKPK